MGPSRFCRSVPLFFLSLFLVLFCVTPRLSQPIMLSRSRSSFLPHLRRLFSFSFFFFLFSFHFPFLSSSYSVLCLSLFPLLSVIEPVPCPPHPTPTNLSITFFSKCLFICAYSHDGFVWRARRLGSQLAGERARAPALLYFLPLSFFL